MRLWAIPQVAAGLRPLLEGPSFLDALIPTVNSETLLKVGDSEYRGLPGDNESPKR